MRELNKDEIEFLIWLGMNYILNGCSDENNDREKVEEIIVNLMIRNGYSYRKVLKEMEKLEK